MKKIYLFLIILTSIQSSLFAQTSAEKKWVKHQFKSLSLEEKIAQLMVLNFAT